MIFIHSKDVNQIDPYIDEGKCVFILVYMEGCGPCNATRPEWAKMELALEQQYGNNDKLVIIDINKDFISHIKHIGSVEGFPTMKYIGNHGKVIQSYEDSSISKKDRSVNSFINWIESKINKMISRTETSSAKHVYKRLAKKSKHPRKKQHGGKWTRKYKSTINCKKPKGFSQRQYCKFGRK